MEWSLTDAKNKFSELFTLAMTTGPQRVLRRDGAIIVLSEHDYAMICNKKLSFKALLMQPDPSLEGVDLTRDSDAMREIEW